MRKTAAAGLLFVVGLILLVSGFSGTLGDVLGAIFAPDQMVFTEANKSGEIATTELQPKA